ncbi:hypothetical protein GQ53DRAFT_726241 [Thozetella sp. PMI_491]|nr:hypothetical protein GQ53DRAFT_726241 [Thozetella sp. PMI_491]
MAAPDQVRYSTGKNDIGAAKNFNWEHPIPDNKFWRDVHFTTGRNFLQSFPPEEVEALPIDPDSAESLQSKLRLLLRLLDEKLAKEDAAAAPQTYFDVAFPGWDKLMLAKFDIQDKLDDPEAETTLRTMIDLQKDKGNLSHFHTLTMTLIKKGEYAEAEQTELPVRDWLDGKLGKHSPQSIGARRMIAEAVWRQGPARRAEAEKLFAELREIIDGSGEGPFGVYQEEHREDLEKLLAKLQQE